MDKKILVVDDEKEIRELLEIYLTNDGYQVIKAADGEEALDILDKGDIGLMVLDIMMPGLDGLAVCRAAREKSNLPILMLSAKSENIDKVQGILTGADDYMTKPFDALELTVRVKALLRRTYYFNHREFVDNNILNVDYLTIDKLNHKVSYDGREIILTA